MKLIARGGKWQVHFTDHNGARVRMSTRVKVDPLLPDKGESAARLAAAERMVEALSDTLTLDDRRRAPAVYTLAHALDRAMSSRWGTQKSAAHRRKQVNVLKKEIGYWPLESVSYERLVAYCEELEAEGAKPATRNRRMSTIQTALKDAKRIGWRTAELPDFPSFPENNIKERYLSDEEERRILEHMRGNAAAFDIEAHYAIAAVELLVDTGCRAGELTFTADQVRGNKLHLRHGSTKSGKGRAVPLTKRAQRAAARMLASPVHEQMRALKVKKEGAPTEWLGGRFRTVVRALKIEGVSLHTLRHTCASRLIMAGVPIYQVSKWLGHSSVTVTERYAHLAPELLDDAVAALEAREVDTRFTVAR